MRGGKNMKHSRLSHYIILLTLCIFGFTSITYAAQVNSLTLNISFSQDGCSVSGIVTAAESGLPLTQGTISIAGITAPINNGKYSISNVSPGVQTVIIEGPYRQPFTAAVCIENGFNRFNFTVDPIFAQQEIDVLAKITRAEAEGESEVGKIAVAATILNRVKSPRYPETISGVVYQRISGRYQYSPVADGRIKLAPRVQDYQAAYRALAGEDPSNGATGFYNPTKTRDKWVRSHPITAIIDGHTFFKY